MMLAFDMPQPLSTFGRRTDSNVPAQALIMMNDPFVVEQAKLWGKRMLAAGPDDGARVRAAYALAFSREPRTRNRPRPPPSSTSKPRPTAKPSLAKKPGPISATRC